MHTLRPGVTKKEKMLEMGGQECTCGHVKTEGSLKHLKGDVSSEIQKRSCLGWTYKRFQLVGLNHSHKLWDSPLPLLIHSVLEYLMAAVIRQVLFYPQEMLGNVWKHFQCHRWEVGRKGSAIGIYWVQTSNAAKHSIMYRTPPPKTHTTSFIQSKSSVMLRSSAL